MRGKLSPDPVEKSFGRITPAHAGKTAFFSACNRFTSDHPRACGENGFLVVAAHGSNGSPPRMRGKRSAGACQGRPARITPAHAGKTRHPASLLTEPADHPRACGENWQVELFHLPHHGSPPRMRGKPGHKARDCHPERITPAHAGKTGQGLHGGLQRPDHPRACGENKNNTMEGDNNDGSPPRMRGKPFLGQTLPIT